MLDFTKLANFLDSFQKDDPGYDAVEFIKEKIAEDIFDKSTVNNGDEENLEDNDITMSTANQQVKNNLEGKIMDGAFQELDILNKLKEEKERINIPGKKDRNGNTSLDEATDMAYDIGDNHNKQASLYDLLIKKFRN